MDLLKLGSWGGFAVLVYSLDGSVYRRRNARGAPVSVPRMNSMTGPSTFDETGNDHKRFEAELVAQDRDTGRVSTADVDEATARQLVNDLVDNGIVTAVAEQRILVHEPSDEAFDSIRQLAVFHRGWTAARDAGEEGE